MHLFSGPVPLYGAFVVNGGPSAKSLLFFIVSFLVRSESPVSSSRPTRSSEPGARRSGQGGRVAPPPKALSLTAASTTARLSVSGRRSEGSPRVARTKDRARNLVFGGAKTPTMMQLCASAAKLRGGGPILCYGIEAMELAGTPPPRTVIGDLSQACGQYRNRQCTFGALPFSVPDAGRRPRAPRHCGRSATRRSGVCAPRRRSLSCASRGRSRCAH